MNRIALALAVAAVSASAAAAQSDPYAYLHQQLKAYEAKTTAADPNAPAAPAAPAATSRREPFAGNNNWLLDGCVITAIGKLPQADGMRVVNTAYEHRSTSGKFDYYAVGVRVNYKGREAIYQWICRVFDNVSAQLIENR